MEGFRGGSLVALLALGIVAAVWAARGEAGSQAAAEAGAAPVVLELFTSQGCSSCPPADRLLSRLGSSPEWRGRVIPLAFHVDYWNYIGWTDPFSRAEWSARQGAYAEAWRTGRIYTPQLVVQGRFDCNGADEACVERAVRATLSRPPPWLVELRVEPGAEGSLAVTVEARLRGEGDRDGAVPELLVALFESGLETRVGRGENARRTLANDFVVRSLERAPLPGRGGTRRVELALDPGWDRRRLGVAAYLQEPETRVVVGSALAAAGAVAGAAGAEPGR